MIGIIPQNKIDEIRDANDIADLISGYLTLKRSGQNFFGLCPFHPEKTPSFSVNPAKQIFHCFGCHAGGNVFAFLMRYEGLTFPEAAKFLAQRAGIELEFDQRDDTEVKESETLSYVNEFAAKFFHEMLNSEKGVKAQAYLKGRGITADDIETFDLGYAPPGWDNLLAAAKNASHDPMAVVNAGLALKKEDGGMYDRFRDRVMFPIRNLSGRVVAFGGRVLVNEENVPKYINSPETAIYHKGQLLYGLYQTRDEIRRQDAAIFVEGYMDLLGLVTHDVKNVVASLGTALTDNQARLIRRYTRNIHLMYDSDIAGSAATLRGADILIEQGLDARVISLPEGHDPDSFVREKGGEAVASMVASAPSLFDYKLNVLTTVSPEERNEHIHSLIESLSRMTDRIQRGLLIAKMSEKLGLSERMLWSELDVVRTKARRNKKSSYAEIEKQIESFVSTQKKTSKLERAVEDLVRILLHKWEMAELVFANIEQHEVEGTRFLPLLEYLKNHFKGGMAPTEETLLHGFSDVEISAFVVKEFESPLEQEDVAAWTMDCLKVLKQEAIQRQIESLTSQVKNPNIDKDLRRQLLDQCYLLEQQKYLLQQVE